jgi:hypothetical protein
VFAAKLAFTAAKWHFMRQTILVHGCLWVGMFMTLTGFRPAPRGPRGWCATHSVRGSAFWSWQQSRTCSCVHRAADLCVVAPSDPSGLAKHAGINPVGRVGGARERASR